MIKSTDLPVLPYQDWTETRITIHLIFQIIGKTKLNLTQRKNHWWNTTVHVTPKGFASLPIPSDKGLHSLEIEFNIFQKAIVFTKSNGEIRTIDLAEEPTVANFYKQFIEIVTAFGLEPKFIKRPFDMGIDTPFNQIENYHHYDWEYIHRFWQIMRWNHDIFQEFSGRYYGKSCPVHIYWHHLDLTVTRFSGKKLPPVDKSSRISEKDTYTHEQISFGFWVGDDQVQEPMYYSYTYPSPENLDQEPLRPEAAQWVDSNGSPMALLSYAAVKDADDPRSAVLSFLESAYQAGARKAGWDVDQLTVPSLDEL